MPDETTQNAADSRPMSDDERVMRYGFGGPSAVIAAASERQSPFRLFHLTIGVYVPKDGPMPETFADWIERAGFECHVASPTTLERVVELRYPLADDVIERRSERTAHLYA